MSLTFHEVLTIQWRILQNAFDGSMMVGPATAVGMGTAVTWFIGAREGYLHLKPSSSSSTTASSSSSARRWYFCARYGLAQVIPSLIWATQPASLVATLTQTPSTLVYTTTSSSLPPPRRYAVARLCALRGAVAGSVLLSQVVALMGVVLKAREAYVTRCVAGREPPLSGGRDDDDGGVVIRLAGRESNVTDFSLATEGGRKAVFPVFEDVTRVHHRDRMHDAVVPRYWQVDDGRYSQKDSWKGLFIPRHWLFRTAGNTGHEKVLVLEADATTGGNDSWSLQRTGVANELDLDLYEVAQGFDQLQSLALRQHDNVRVVRVLLVDTEMRHVSGGGRVTAVRDYVSELNLSDIVIDARGPLMEEMLTWLEKVTTPDMKIQPSVWGRLVGAFVGSSSSSSSAPIPVILETPHREWFASIRDELAPHGYRIIDRVQAGELQVGQTTTAADLPVLVYENSSADTVHTIRRLVRAGIVTAHRTCALITDHEGWRSAATRLPPGAHGICSSHVYAELFSWVRRSVVLHDHDYSDIQRDLDDGRVPVLRPK